MFVKWNWSSAGLETNFYTTVITKLSLAYNDKWSEFTITNRPYSV